MEILCWHPHGKIEPDVSRMEGWLYRQKGSILVGLHGMGDGTKPIMLLGGVWAVEAIGTNECANS